MALFSNGKSDSADAGLDQITTIIAQGTVIDGPLTSKEGTRIDGTINGNVSVNGSLIVGQEAKIVGAVTATNLFLAGEIQGNVGAPTGKVEISDTGKLIGDLSAKVLVIDENAVFQGQCTMTQEKTSAETAKERALGGKEE
ncbi:MULTISPECIES: bactofilin family protein [unclassified Butyrivibrio]|jgi:cytoskeletal protein CcmA (bactofilin family)|uniref:bactofilin family protein n=1 Tax=unclassified Butyrivibrio TaxID=2639466 RepID=UPI000406EE7D|nr:MULTISPECIES: polymer-forming cytoskeletal protein [unclassified Butyrivibrio]